MARFAGNGARSCGQNPDKSKPVARKPDLPPFGLEWADSADKMLLARELVAGVLERHAQNASPENRMWAGRALSFWEAYGAALVLARPAADAEEILVQDPADVLARFSSDGRFSQAQRAQAEAFMTSLPGMGPLKPPKPGGYDFAELATAKGCVMARENLYYCSMQAFWALRKVLPILADPGGCGRLADLAGDAGDFMRSLVSGEEEYRALFGAVGRACLEKRELMGCLEGMACEFGQKVSGERSGGGRSGRL